MKTCGSWERAESREALEALQKCAWVVEEGTRWDGLWLCRDKRQGKKTKVARGGWAEDARRRPATSLVSALIALLGTWGESVRYQRCQMCIQRRSASRLRTATGKGA